MTVETPERTDLSEALARAAVAALVDTLAQVEADRKNIKFLTCEIELRNGVPIDARAWIERTCNVNKLLGVSGRG